MSEMTAEEKRLTVEVDMLAAKYDLAMHHLAEMFKASSAACRAMRAMELAAEVGDESAGMDLTQKHYEAIKDLDRVLQECLPRGWSDV